MFVKKMDVTRREIRPASRSLYWKKRAPKREWRHGFGTIDVLCLDVLVIAREATARYREFALHQADCGNDAIADLFSRLSALWAEHEVRLAAIAACRVSSKLASDDHSWLCSGPPMYPEARDFILRIMTPRLALEIATRAEERNKEFFERVLAASNSAAVHELAIELVRDADSHIGWLRDTLVLVPEPFRPTEECPGDPGTPQAM